MTDENNPEQTTAEQIDLARKMVFKDLISKPSTYTVDVLDNTTLPEKLKTRKTLDFTIKPPTTATLTLLAEIVSDIPEDVINSKTLTAEVLNHVPKITQIIAVLAHGNQRKKMPDWYVPFLNDNVTVEEIIMMWQETSLKMQTGFFLPFFQTVKLMNPMQMMTRNEKGILIQTLDGSTLMQ